MMPFYLTTVLQMGQEEEEGTPWQLALVPLIMYLGSVIASFTQPKLQFLSRKTLFIIGSAFIVIGGVPLVFLTSDG